MVQARLSSAVALCLLVGLVPTAALGAGGGVLPVGLLAAKFHKALGGGHSGPAIRGNTVPAASEDLLRQVYETWDADSIAALGHGKKSCKGLMDDECEEEARLQATVRAACNAYGVYGAMFDEAARKYRASGSAGLTEVPIQVGGTGRVSSYESVFAQRCEATALPWQAKPEVLYVSDDGRRTKEVVAVVRLQPAVLAPFAQHVAQMLEEVADAVPLEPHLSEADRCGMANLAVVELGRTMNLVDADSLLAEVLPADHTDGDEQAAREALEELAGRGTRIPACGATLVLYPLDVRGLLRDRLDP